MSLGKISAIQAVETVRANYASLIVCLVTLGPMDEHVVLVAKHRARNYVHQATNLIEVIASKLSMEIITIVADVLVISLVELIDKSR